MPNKPIKKNSKPLKRIRKRTQIDKEINAQVTAAVIVLSEYLSSVQIIGTALLPDGSTQAVSRGSGDLYARIKAAEVFLDNHDRVIHGY